MTYLDLTGVLVNGETNISNMKLPPKLRTLVIKEIERYSTTYFIEPIINHKDLINLNIGLNYISVGDLQKLSENLVNLTSLKMAGKLE